MLSKEANTILENHGFKTIMPLIHGCNVSSIPKEISSNIIIN
jgi:hypothetical protein